MKLGFSTVACPEWDLETIVLRAPGMGYAAVELATQPKGTIEQSWPTLKTDAAAVGQRFRDAGLELACLATNAALSTKGAELASAKTQVCSAIELAGAAGVPLVRIAGGQVGSEPREPVLARIAEALRELASVAAAHGVTLTLENTGDLGGSRDIWFVVDAVASPFVRACWSPVHAAMAGDRMTLAIPRLARMIALVHMADANIKDGQFGGYALPGQGNLGLEHCLELLRGVGYESHLIFHWPRTVLPSLASPDEALPAAATALKGMIDALAAAKDLTAYKGDKNAPKYAGGGKSGAQG